MIKSKKIYLKKVKEVGNFKVWYVNGAYIRTNINEEFTNFGQHYKFNFIPKNEFWIDKESSPGEESYYILHMLHENKHMSKGMSYDKAIDIADMIELKERRKSLLFKKNNHFKKNNIQKLIKKIHLRHVKKYSQNINVWIVDGELIRDLFYIDFTEGGHDKVYKFIPNNEIWVDNDISKREFKYILLHEIYERNLMSKGLDYLNAHTNSSHIEFYCRHHPEKLDIELKREIKKSEILESTKL